jgi:hypothetical protein
VAHVPDVRESLGRGATRQEIDDVEQRLGVKFPPAFRMLYRIHNGQSWPDNQQALDEGQDQEYPPVWPPPPSLCHHTLCQSQSRRGSLRRARPTQTPS